MDQGLPEIKNDDEISIKDLIQKIKSLTNYLKSKWLVILAFGLIGALLGFAYSNMKKPVYTAGCTFVLDDGSKSGGLGQYAGLASLAGIDIGGGSGGIFQEDNIIELYKSRLMLEKTLLSEVDFDNKKQLLIERYIEFNKLRDQWKKNNNIQNISFNGDPDKFNRTQDSIVTNIIDVFNKNLLSVSKPDKKLSIIQVQVSAKDELFAKEFTNKLVDNVNGFYVLTKTKKTSENVRILQHQTDSVRSILNASISGVASAMDATPNANPGLLALRVPSQKRQIDVQSNGAIYAEMIKNLELSKISLRQETPLIQVIDRPVLPLLIDRVSEFKGVIIGFILGCSIITFLMILKNVYNSLME